MKLLLCLLALIPITLSTYTPSYKKCDGVFTTEKVLVLEDPQNITNTTVAVCGFTTTYVWNIAYDHLEVNGTVGNHTWNQSIPYHYDTISGLNFCLNYTGDFAQYKQDVSMRVVAKGIIEKLGIEYIIACVDVNLKRSIQRFLRM